MRFTIGKTYTFSRVLFTQGERRYLGNVYMPWEGDVLKRIEAMNLTCIEHHKVTNGYSDKKDCDGFVFKDEYGRIWDNQYPTASYGQLDDTNDRVVFIRTDDKEIFEWDGDEIKRDANGRSIIKNQKLYDQFEDGYDHRWELCTVGLDKIYRALNQKEDRIFQPAFNPTPEQAEMLEKHLAQFVRKIEQVSKKLVTFEPLVLHFTDGRVETRPDIMKATLRDPEELKVKAA